MDLPVMFSAFNAAVTTYKAAVQLKDAAQIAAATNELQAQVAMVGAQLLSMTEKASDASESERAARAEILDLKDQVRDLEKRISDRERYQLVEDYPGTFTLRLREDRSDGEPIHHLCPNCMDNKAVKSILQFNSGAQTFGSCNECKAVYRFKDSTPLRRGAVASY